MIKSGVASQEWDPEPGVAEASGNHRCQFLLCFHNILKKRQF